MNAIDITKILYQDENIAIVYDGEDKLDDYGPASTFYVLPKIDGKIYPISIGMNMFQYDVEDPIKECPIEVIEKLKRRINWLNLIQMAIIRLKKKSL